MKNTSILLIALFTLFSCKETVYQGNEDLRLTLDMSIDSKAGYRAVDNDFFEAKSQFINGDAIGLFSSNDVSYSKWILNNKVWMPNNFLFWHNRESVYDFYAYYPYVETAQLDNVPMTNLKLQDGTDKSVIDTDFLYAMQRCAYTDNQGKISFTGSNALNHAYALVVVDLKLKQMDDGIMLKNVTLNGEGLFANCKYSFLSPESPIVRLDSDKSGDELSINYSTPVQLDFNKNFRIKLLVNPFTTTSTRFLLKYTLANVEKTAYTEALSKKFQSGYYYHYTMTLNDSSNLVITGATVNGRKVENLPDIILPHE